MYKAYTVRVKKKTFFAPGDADGECAAKCKLLSMLSSPPPLHDTFS